MSIHLDFADKYNLRAAVSKNDATKTLYVWQLYDTTFYFPFEYYGWKVKIINNERFRLN